MNSEEYLEEQEVTECEANEGTDVYSLATSFVSDWPDELYEGTGPKLFTVGPGEFSKIEVGPGRVVLLGGGPGVGKTAVAMQFAFDALIGDSSIRAVICNVEMTERALLERQLSKLSGVPLSLITHRRLMESHRSVIETATRQIQSLADRLAFVQIPNLGYLSATMEEFGGDLIVLDYLQRIGLDENAGDRRAGVDALMVGLRSIANQGRAIIAVSAVARGKDKTGRSSYDGNNLTMASLRESSELEYGADAAYMLSPRANFSDLMDLTCLKHRHGEPVSLGLKFDRAIQRFTTPELSAPARPKTTARQLGTKK